MVTRLAAVAVGAMVAVAGLSTTASATEADEGAYSTSFWDGGGVLTDDFGDHRSEIGNDLCNGCANSWDTGTVRAWQAILFVEGYLNVGDIDGKFGSRTHTATWNYQADHGLGKDGRVGSATWGHADGHLKWYSSQTGVVYDGAQGSVYFERGNSAHGNAGGGGAYRLEQACNTADGDCKYFGSIRVYH